MEENNNQQPQYQQYQQYQVPQGQYQQPQYQQPQYQQPQYQYQQYQYQQYQQRPTTGASIASLILGILSILAPGLMIIVSVNSYIGLDLLRVIRISFVGIVSGIIAIILGAKERRSGLGKAGLVCGIIGTLAASISYMITECKVDVARAGATFDELNKLIKEFKEVRESGKGGT